VVQPVDINGDGKMEIVIMGEIFPTFFIGTLSIYC
jgi:hypothetical protein